MIAISPLVPQFLKLQGKLLFRRPLSSLVQVGLLLLAAVSFEALGGLYDESFPVIDPATNYFGWYRWRLILSLLDPNLPMIIFAGFLFIPRWLIRLSAEVQEATSASPRETYLPLLFLPIGMVIMIITIRYGVGPATHTPLIYGTNLTSFQHRLVGYLITITSMVNNIFEVILFAAAFFLCRKNRSAWPLAAIVGFLVLDAFRIFQNDIIPPHYNVPWPPTLVYAIGIEVLNVGIGAITFMAGLLFLLIATKRAGTNDFEVRTIRAHGRKTCGTIRGLSNQP